MGVEMVVNDPLQQPSTLELRESVIARTSHAAVSLHGANGSVIGTAMREVTPAAIAGGGAGVVVAAVPAGIGGIASVASSIVSDTSETGIWLDGGSIDIDGVLIRDTVPLAGVGSGQGFMLTPGSVPSVGAIRSSRVERSGAAGIASFDSQLDVLATVVEATHSDADDGTFGDGILVIHHDQTAQPALVSGSVVSRSMRAGVTTFGSELTLLGTDLVCNPIAINGGDGSGESYTLINGGGNRCGCDDISEDCRVLSAGVSPPTPLDPTFQDF